MGVPESWEKTGKSKVGAVLKYQDKQEKKLLSCN